MIDRSLPSLARSRRLYVDNLALLERALDILSRAAAARGRHIYRQEDQ